jgi:hypothetical protein
MPQLDQGERRRIIRTVVAAETSINFTSEVGRDLRRRQRYSPCRETTSGSSYKPEGGRLDVQMSLLVVRGGEGEGEEEIDSVGHLCK